MSQCEYYCSKPPLSCCAPGLQVYKAQWREILVACKVFGPVAPLNLNLEELQKVSSRPNAVYSALENKPRWQQTVMDLFFPLASACGNARNREGGYVCLNMQWLPAKAMNWRARACHAGQQLLITAAITNSGRRRHCCSTCGTPTAWHAMASARHCALW